MSEASNPHQPPEQTFLESASNESDAPPAVAPAASSNVGIWLIIAAAVLWSTSGFFAKSPWFSGWPPTVLAFWRTTFAGLILIPLVRRVSWSWWMLPMGITFAAMMWTYMQSLVEIPANAIWLQFTAPAWVALYSTIVLREPLHPRDWRMLGLAMLGIIVILIGEASAGRLGALSFGASQGTSSIAVWMGLASGILYAAIVLFLRKLRDHDSAWLSVWNHLSGACFLAAPMLITPQPKINAFHWGVLAAFGILQMGLPYTLFARALRTLKSHQAVMLGLLEPILLPIWVWLAWGDVPPPWTMVGGGLILTGMLWRYWPIGDETLPK